MQAEKKKKALLAALAALLAVYFIAGYAFKGRQAAAPPGHAGKKKPAASTPRAEINVDLELLERPRPAYTAERNMFSPVYKKPVLEKPAGKKGPGAGTVTVTPLPPLPPPPPPKPQEEIDRENAREEMRKIRVLGFLKRKDRTDVFMALGGDNFVVGKGERIIKDYYLAEVGTDSLLIVDRKTGVEVRLSTDTGKGGARTVPLPGAAVTSGASSASAPPPPQQRPGSYSPGRTVLGRPGMRTGAGGPAPLQNGSIR